jgi:KipI family sensor histidine kinase inhibitor
MIQAHAAGDTGLLIDTDQPPAWLAAAIAEASLPGVCDIVPGARTVLVISSPGESLPPAELAARIAALPVPARADAAAGAVEIPVVYDGPDLAEVAALTGLSVQEVIAAHAGGSYTVGWIGFSPGFGYLTGLDQRLAAVPRLTTPRLEVPAGSVAIAAGLAAVYPAASPGGWHILGHTTLRLWDADRDPAALLSPGRGVRFTAMPADQSGSAVKITPISRKKSPEASQSRMDSRSPVPGRGDADHPGNFPVAARLEVIRSGPLATVQDLGRPGLGAIGVPPSGAADAASLIAANRLVGNRDDAAAIELTLGRAAFRFTAPATVAVTGAPAPVTATPQAQEQLAAPPSHHPGPATTPKDQHRPPESPGHHPGFGAALEGQHRPQESPGRHPGFGAAFEVPAGGEVSIGAPQAGLRTYLAVAGGIDTPVVLGSRSADLLSRLGGGPLRAGDRLAIGAVVAGDGGKAGHVLPGAHVPIRGGVARLRVTGGPRLDWFTADALDELCANIYTVSPASNRTGLRLDGPPLTPASDAELPSEGLVTGALQVPRDGRPILLLADHPTTGGYPVIGVIVSTDLKIAAQLRPGDQLVFVAIT